MTRIRYFIHGNGHDSTCAPRGFQADDLPGHGSGPRWDSYSFEAMVDYLVDIVPTNAFVLGHSLGGHLALNLALKRKDINIAVCGMAPLKGVEEIGTVMLPISGFDCFQNPDRSLEDIVAFSKHSSLDNKPALDLLVAAALRQDPEFNVKLFTSGIGSYDWNEVTKAKSLKNRFTLIISRNEACYNADLLHKLGLPTIEDNYLGHTPWLIDPNWAEKLNQPEPTLNS